MMSGLTDRVSGRIKQAAGDLIDDQKLREQGVQEERKAQAKEELTKAQAEVDARSEEIAALERDGAHERAQRRAGAPGPGPGPGATEPGQPRDVSSSPSQSSATDSNTA